MLVEAVVRGGKNQSLLESAAELVNSVAKEGMKEAGGSDEAGGRLSGYKELARQNRDLAGWICIEGTGIDYPVMQTEEEDFYLNHNFRRESSAYGVPFVDRACELGEGCRNVVLYGHHMKDGSMFADLVRYAEKSFYEEHPVIRFDTLDECGEYQITGVLIVPAVEAEMEFYTNMQAGDEWQYKKFVNEVTRCSLYDCGVEIGESASLLTLITCEYSMKEGRMVVVARKIS